jgi:hypothetical protein
MIQNTAPHYLRPLSIASYEPRTKQDARARREARAFDGWLAGRMRAGAAARRRVAAERKR